MAAKHAALAVALAAFPGAAGAQAVSGLYIGAAAGVNFRIPSTFEDAGPGGGATFGFNSRRNAVTSDPGVVGVVSLGWGFGNGLRTELEGNVRSNPVSRFKFLGRAHEGATGDLRTYGFMVNALYDLDLRRFGVAGSPVAPYLGLGIGLGVNDWDARAGATPADPPSALLPTPRIAGLRLRDRSVDFAYQAIVGGAWSLDGLLAGLSLTTEYRFYGTTDPTLRLTAAVASPAPIPAIAPAAPSAVTGSVGSVNVVPSPSFASSSPSPAAPTVLSTSRAVVQATNHNHALLIGLRYAFNPPAPPAASAEPPPAPPPAAARTYLVFFDWDRADLTARAREVVAQAAANARGGGTSRVEVAGHADRSGTPAHNAALSRRRADAVAAELVRGGVARDAIGVTALGESRPLVPTADGVREPQNRRVEVVLR